VRLSRTNADRVAAQRAAQAQAAADRAIAVKAAAKRDEISRLARRAEALIPRVLDALAARDYAGIEQIDVYVPRSGLGRMLGRDRLAAVGAYGISSYSYRESSSRPAGTDYVRLLSSRRIAVGSGSRSVSQFEQAVLNHEGLGQPGNWNLSGPFSKRGLSDFVRELEALAA
jgi:hypothetical protein